MLQQIRDRAQGWVAAVIIGFICIPFAFWGIGSYFGAGAEPGIAEVDGSEISQREFQEVYQRRYAEEQRRFGENFRPEFINEANLRQDVLENLIRRRAMLGWLNDSGYAVADTQLAADVRDNPTFADDDGKFSMARYKDLLRQFGESPESYEASLRQQIKLEQLQTGIIDTALVTTPELQRVYRLENEEREFAFVRIDVNKLIDAQDVTDERVAEFFEENKEDFKTQERLKVQYVELSAKTIAATVQVDEGEVVTRYAENAERYTVPEKRKARHILIRTDDETDESAATAAIAALAARIKGGEDFAEVAKAHSQDPGSAKSGGDLGLVGRGAMVAPFEEALFAQEAGVLGEPVVTQFGVHLIQVDEIQPERVQPLEEVREELATSIKQERAAERYVDLAEQMTELAYENPESIQSVADGLGLQVKTSDWFSRLAGNGLFREAQLRRAAFAPGVLQEQRNSEPVELSGERVVVMRLAEHDPAKQREFADVKDSIKHKLKLMEARNAAKALGEELLALAEGGIEPLRARVEAAGLSLEEPGFVTRDDPVLPRNVSLQAFRMKVPEAGKYTAINVPAGNGEQTVVLLKSVREPDALALDSSAAKTLRARLDAQRGQAEFSALVRDIRSRRDVVINAVKAQTPES